MEADNVQGNIQRKLNKLVDHHSRIFTPGRLQEVLEQTVSTKPYLVTELTRADARDYKGLAAKLLRSHSLDGISQIRAMKFERVSFNFQ